MKLLHVSAAVALSGFLAACAGNMAEECQSFECYLADDYAGLSSKEASRADVSDSMYFAGKSSDAADGERPYPSTVLIRDIKAFEHNDELTSAKVKLTYFFTMGSRDDYPAVSADAQAMFDCWVEETEEAQDTNVADECRETFWEDIAYLEKAYGHRETDEVLVKAMPDLPFEVLSMYKVYFDHDSAGLGDHVEPLLKEISEAVNTYRPSKVVLSGFSDRTGNQDYNYNLSRKRAEAVRQRLENMGVMKEMLDIQYFGETNLPVATEDGVRNPRNRVVTVYFAK